MDILTFRLRALAETIRAITDRLGSRADGVDARLLSLGTAASKNISIGNTAPSNPTVDDLWVDTN